MPVERRADRLERIAEILVDASVSRDDRKTAERFQVSDRTIRNYRRQLETDAELAALFRQKRAQVSEGWANEVPGALREAVGFLRRAAEKGDCTNPNMVHAVAGAMKLLSEVSATWKLLDVRMARSAGAGGATHGASAAPSAVQRAN